MNDWVFFKKKFPLIQLPKKSEAFPPRLQDEGQVQFPLIQLPKKSEDVLAQETGATTTECFH